MNFQELYNIANEHEITGEDLELANFYCENYLESGNMRFSILHVFQMER